MRPLALVFSLLAASSCATTGPARAVEGGACASVRDCAYGLACLAREAGADRSCRYESFGECEKPEDCLAGHTCRDGACTVQCVSDSDCDGGRCLVGECATSETHECVLPSDCGTGRDCVAGRCEQKLSLRCFTDLDCRPTESCFGGWCR